MAHDEVFATGLQLNFLKNKSSEPLIADSEEEGYSIVARNLWRALMMGCPSAYDLKDIVSRKVLQSVLHKPEPKLTQVLREEFQSGMSYVHQQLCNNTPMNQLQHNQAELYISNCLTYIPYIEPEENSVLSIPQYIGDTWQLIEYKINYIELTNPSKKNQYQRDRVFAFGLTPVDTAIGANPLLIFPGTTYPAGQGFWSHIESDFRAFQGVGENLYAQGRDRIQKWANSCTIKPKVCGVSLGGSLALLFAVDMGNIACRVDAFNPAGLYVPLWGGRKDNWENFSASDKPKVYVQKQGNDIVSMLIGYWKDDFIVLQSRSSKEHAGRHGFSNHAINLAGCEQTEYIEIDAEMDNQQRKLRNLIFYTLLRAALYYATIAPTLYVALPTVRVMLYLSELIITTCISFANLMYTAAAWTVNAMADGLLLIMDTLYTMTKMAPEAPDCFTGDLSFMAEQPDKKRTRWGLFKAKDQSDPDGLGAEEAEVLRS